jgi:hypothetical protein
MLKWFENKNNIFFKKFSKLLKRVIIFIGKENW